jgi:hypothetical protein
MLRHKGNKYVNLRKSPVKTKIYGKNDDFHLNFLTSCRIYLYFHSSYERHNNHCNLIR